MLKVTRTSLLSTRLLLHYTVQLEETRIAPIFNVPLAQPFKTAGQLATFQM